MHKITNLTVTAVISLLLFFGNSNFVRAEVLSMIEKDGLPIPAQAKQYHVGHKLFTASANFDVDSPPEAVVALYSDEFLKRGWKVEPQNISTDHTVVHFTTPNGPGTLDIINSGYSIVEVVIINQVAAAKSPLAPKSGMVTLLFSNKTKKLINVSVGGMKIKIAAGATSPFKKASGLEVAPGKLRVKVGEMAEQFEATSGQIWISEISDGYLLSSKQN
jgi:hypothetical protein